MKKIIVIALMCAMVVGGAFARGAQDGEFPSRPVTAMVAWAAGGGADMVFRALGEVFPNYANGQPLVIVNRGEAAGVPGIMDFRINAAPDGHHVMHWNIAHVIKTHWDEVPFTATEFTPIAQVIEASNYLLVPADARWQTLQDFIDDARANPGQIIMGNAGVGGGNHLAAVLFERAAGIQLVHMPFAGGGPSVTGLMTGDSMSSSNVAPEGLANVQAGQLRLLAVFSNERFAEFPNVPTAREAGVDFVYEQWRGVVAPPGTPANIVQKLQEIFRQCVENPTYIQRTEAMSARAVFADAGVLGELIASEDLRIGTVLRENRIGNRYR